MAEGQDQNKDNRSKTDANRPATPSQSLSPPPPPIEVELGSINFEFDSGEMSCEE